MVTAAVYPPGKAYGGTNMPLSEFATAMTLEQIASQGIIAYNIGAIQLGPETVMHPAGRSMIYSLTSPVFVTIIVNTANGSLTG